MPIWFIGLMYIEYGWSDKLVDPDKPNLSDTECELSTVPTNG